MLNIDNFYSEVNVDCSKSTTDGTKSQISKLSTEYSKNTIKPSDSQSFNDDESKEETKSRSDGMVSFWGSNIETKSESWDVYNKANDAIEEGQHTNKININEDFKLPKNLWKTENYEFFEKFDNDEVFIKLTYEFLK